jgi:hypothetical protein
MPDDISIPLRWLHIASMATLVGGIIFWRMALARAGVDEKGGAFTERVAAAFRPMVFASIAGLIFSGFFNFLAAPGHTRLYHIMFGIKMLLALHVFAVSILIVQPNQPRRTRMATGTMISALVILLISAWLRRNF